ncbi:MAG: T9SS type A sorting domain-containing protein [Saprospiraceae bacterium]|nr:T9SS type A sorting domain-containing protein [Saprospiraceae bacterium]
MMRNLLFVLLVCFSTGLVAQFSATPVPLSISVPSSATESIHDVAFTNLKDSTYTVFWKLDKPASFESSWEISVCDLNLCYTSAVEKCPGSKPNIFPKNTYNFQFHFKPNGVLGNSIVGVKLYADKNFTQELLSTTINITVSTPSSTKDLNISNIKIYPNPAADYFQISNAGNVKKIVVFNMFGKEIKTYFHYNNAQHEISDLKTGMYIVKLMDDKNKLVKTIKLNKTFDGA